jgi:hypothetical protein
VDPSWAWKVVFTVQLCFRWIASYFPDFLFTSLHLTENVTDRICQSCPGQDGVRTARPEEAKAYSP